MKGFVMQTRSLDDHEQIVAEPPRIENLSQISDEQLWITAIDWVAKYPNQLKKIAGGILRNGLVEFGDLLNDASVRAFEVLKELAGQGSIEAFVPMFFKTFKFDCLLQVRSMGPTTTCKEIPWERIEDHNSEDYWSFMNKIEQWENIDTELGAAMALMTNKQKKVICLLTGFHYPRMTREEIATEMGLSINSNMATDLTVGFRAPALTYTEVATRLNLDVSSVYRVTSGAFKRVREGRKELIAL